MLSSVVYRGHSWSHAILRGIQRTQLVTLLSSVGYRGHSWSRVILCRIQRTQLVTCYPPQDIGDTAGHVVILCRLQRTQLVIYYHPQDIEDTAGHMLSSVEQFTAGLFTGLVWFGSSASRPAYPAGSRRNLSPTCNREQVPVISVLCARIMQGLIRLKPQAPCTTNLKRTIKQKCTSAKHSKHKLGIASVKCSIFQDNNLVTQR